MDCKAAPNPGYGRAAHRMLYYNEERNTCERFIYGGIPVPPANGNRFDSCEKCIKECGNSKTECIIKPDPEDLYDVEEGEKEKGEGEDPIADNDNEELREKKKILQEMEKKSEGKQEDEDEQGPRGL